MNDEFNLEVIYTSVVAKHLYSEGPNYGTADAAGFDLRAVTNGTLMLAKGTQLKIGTGIKIDLNKASVGVPECIKFAALVLPRSGLGSNKGLTLGNGTGLIDQDYHGEIFCTMRLRSDAPVDHLTIYPGDRIAQFVIVPVFRPVIKVVESFTTSTERGEAGYGSTGVA